MNPSSTRDMLGMKRETSPSSIALGNFLLRRQLKADEEDINMPEYEQMSYLFGNRTILGKALKTFRLSFYSL